MLPLGPKRRLRFGQSMSALRSRLGAQRSSQPLKIRGARDSEVARLELQLFERPIQQLQFLPQGSTTALGQSFQKIHKHGPQATSDLEVLHAVDAYFPTG